MFRFVLATLIAGTCVMDPPQEDTATAEAGQSQPASQPAGQTVSPRNPTQARILQELLRDAEQTHPRPILSDPGPEGDSLTGVGDEQTSLLPDGYPLVERQGRLVRSGERVKFHFTSGSPAGEAPDVMEFNKNRWLEAMEAEAEAGVTEFIISAEVTRYRGRNYLNLLKYRRQVTHGNLSP